MSEKLFELQVITLEGEVLPYRSNLTSKEVASVRDEMHGLRFCSPLYENMMCVEQEGRKYQHGCSNTPIIHHEVRY